METRYKKACVEQSGIYLYISLGEFFFFMLVSPCAHITQILSHKNMDAVILYSSLGSELEQVKSTEQLGMRLLCISGSQFCRSYNL